ncbi:MAG: DUF4215 domain-containing protein [Deltaproteobacteria bacterium]|nr:DUF4215 domain-containing protein [Deltaproteobacteria bacterium]
MPSCGSPPAWGRRAPTPVAPATSAWAAAQWSGKGTPTGSSGPPPPGWRTVASRSRGSARHDSPCVSGNGRLERGELCDDGNNAAGDACPADCREPVTPAVCGNGAVESGEACDDGNTTALDGCSPTCQLEPVPVPTANAGCGCAVAGAAGGSVFSLLLLALAALRRKRR